jgi:hypothetical protein
MDIALSSLINLYAFSTGRRLFALRQVHKLAKQMSLADLEAHTAAAIKHDHKTHEIELKWSALQHAPQAATADPGKTKRIDAQVDRALTAIRDTAQAQIAGAEDDDKELAGQIEAVLKDLFPAGLQAVTTLPYVDELNAVDAIVGKLQGTYAALAGEIGLGRLVKRLAKLAAEYRAAQEASAPSGPRFDDVRAARAEGQERLLQAVAMILGAYPKSSKEHLAARGALLDPILKQNEAIRQYLRARRSVEDVNPDTGEVDPNAPAAPEANAPK